MRSTPISMLEYMVAISARRSVGAEKIVVRAAGESESVVVTGEYHDRRGRDALPNGGTEEVEVLLLATTPTGDAPMSTIIT